MTDTLVMIAGLLADEAPHDTGPDFGKASPFGLLIVVLLLIGTFLLGVVDEPAPQAGCRSRSTARIPSRTRPPTTDTVEPDTGRRERRR